MQHFETGIPFKFCFVLNGARTLLAKKGIADEENLTLGKHSLKYDDIIDTVTRDNRLILVLSTEAQLDKKLAKFLNDDVCLVLEIFKVKTLKLERYIDRKCSLRQIEKNKQRLKKEGKANLFKTSVCPACNATIDLSELPNTQFTYCRFCESVFSKSGLSTDGSQYKICDECGLFGRVRGYTEAYFYFFIVVYGYSYKKRFLCDCCVNGVFWKTLLYNLIFILGVPSSIWMKIKSMSGRDDRDKDLALSIKLSKKGNYEQAGEIYRRLHQNYHGHPGIYFNEALCHLNGGNGDAGIDCLEKSLSGCCNYIPAIQLLSEFANEDN